MDITDFLLKNKKWVAEKLAQSPDFFQKLSQGQSPSVFWIGCSDSRVMAGQFLQVGLGEIFVHRNVANQIRGNDPSLLASLDYAVNVLKVDHVVVCGHTHCGGVQAAQQSDSDFSNLSNEIKNWIQPLREELQKGSPKKSQEMAMEMTMVESCALNVKNQVGHLLEMAPLKKSSRNVFVHGWLFQMEEGLLKEICSFSNHGESGE